MADQVPVDPSHAQLVLILDTDAAQRDLLRMALARGGFSPVCTGDPVQAEHLLQTRPYQFVILELLLPGMNGLRFIRRIRENPSVHQPHFILMSSLGFKEVVEQVAALRVAGFVKKPVDLPKLLQRLQDLSAAGVDLTGSYGLSAGDPA